MLEITKFVRHVKDGNFSFIIRVIKKRVFSRNESYGLKRDLNIPFDNPDAQIPISIRTTEPGDDEYFSADKYNYGITEQGLKTCYVATNEEGIPCYRQWLMGEDQNHQVRSFWKDLFPVLSSDEALLENAYTVPEFRGKRIMPAAMARIAQKGADLGARYIITFVEVHNVPSLKGCKRSGFSPYILRKENWFLFYRTIQFTAVDDEHLLHYSKVTSGKDSNVDRPAASEVQPATDSDFGSDSNSEPIQPNWSRKRKSASESSWSIGR